MNNLKEIARAIGGTYVAAKAAKLPHKTPIKNSKFEAVDPKELAPLLASQLSMYLSKRGVDASISLNKFSSKGSRKHSKTTLSGIITVYGVSDQHVDTHDFKQERHDIEIFYDLKSSIKAIRGETWEVHGGTVKVTIGSSSDTKQFSVIFDDETFLGALALGRQLSTVGDMIADLVYDGDQ